MTAFLSQQTGNWSRTSDNADSPWYDGGAQTALSAAPGNGDTATVNHDVTVDADVTIGTSDVAGTLVLDVDGGDLTVAEGVTLTLRGDMEVDVGDTLTLQAGATLKFDSSLAADPPNTAYRLSLSNTYYQAGYLVCSGTAVSRCKVTSETANSAAYGYIKAVTTAGLSGNVQADYTDFQYLGSASIEAVYTHADSTYTGNSWYKDCTFDNCGAVKIFKVEATRTFTIQRTKFTNPLASADFAFGQPPDPAGTVVFDDVVFGAGPATLSGRFSISFTSCYFPKPPGSSGTGQWAAFSGNLILDQTNLDFTTFGTSSADGFKDNLVFEDHATNNPHWVDTDTAYGNIVIDGCVFDCSGDGNQAGDVVMFQKGSAGNRATVKNCISLPDSTGASPGKLISCLGDANVTVDVYHNTAVVAAAEASGVGVGETYLGHAGQVANVKSNIFWTPASETAGWKAYRSSSSNVQDIITPAGWDYNWGWNIGSGSEGNGFQDSGGPGDMFSTVPTDSNGGSDDPAFYDSLRSVALYDSADDGLANYAPSWATSTAYTVGDIVENSDANYYLGASINYRCIADHTSGATTEPGVGASWRANWELATLYRMRENTSVISSCLQWIKDGYAPTNQSLENAGHDSVTIGAIEYVEATPTPTPSPGFAQALTTWESNMLTYGAIHAAKWADSTYDFVSGYYDAQRVFYNIADYTEDTGWLTTAETAGDAYRDQYVVPSGGVVTGYWNFTRGLYEDWDRNADASSKAALISLSENAAYARDVTPLASTVNADLSREVAYAINSYIDAERAGETHRTRMDDLIDQTIGVGGHFEQWFTDESDPDFAPFMFALSAEALINYYTHISEDADIITAIQAGADYIWANAWVAADRSFYYRMNAPTATAPDLNLLIAPVFGWLYWKTGDTAYRDAGDEIFRGGVDLAWLNGSKQFNQNYRWSFDYITWRSAAASATSVLVKFISSSGRLVLQTKQN